MEEESFDESEETASDDVVDDSDDDNDSNSNDIQNNESNHNDSSITNKESELDALDNKLENNLASGGIHEGICCAAYMIQLAVWDVLEKNAQKDNSKSTYKYHIIENLVIRSKSKNCIRI